MAVFLLFCWLTGVFFGLFAPFFIQPTLIAPFLLLGLVLWALPDTNKAPTNLLVPSLFVLLAAIYLWPNYLAIAVPGLPWITIVRLILVPYGLVVLLCVSTSSRFRNRVAEVWSAVPWFRNFFLTYTAIEFVSIAFSDHITQSVIIFSQELVTCFGTFVVASYLFREKGRAEQFIGFICCMFSVLMVVGLIEHRMGDVPWAGHIPSFLQINDENVTRFLAGGERGGMHRVQTIFTTPLAFGELGALLFPFFLHFTFNRYAIVVRVLSAVGAAMVPVLMFFSQARVGTVGTFLSLLIYPTLVTLIGWRRAPTLLTSAIVFVSPVFMGIFGILIATVDGLRIRIFGGGATQMSTEARAEQWDLGLPKIEAHPWGYGIGEGASTVGYGNGWGVLTIDTSYLNILVQYGVVGLISYLGLLVAAPAYSFRSMMLAPREDRELQLFVPLTNTFLVFFMIKSSYAQAENAVLIYLLWGLAAALTWRLKQMSGQLNER